MGNNKHNKKKDIHHEVVQRELDLVFNEFNIQNTGRSRESYEGLRYTANDLSQVERLVTKDLLSNMDLKEEGQLFEDSVKVIIYKYYLLMHTVEEYLATGEFMGISWLTFEGVWSKIDLYDKVEIIEMDIITEDALAMVYGTYIVLAQLEREYNQ